MGDLRVGIHRAIARPADKLLALGQHRSVREGRHGVRSLHSSRQAVGLPIRGVERVIGAEGLPMAHVRVQSRARRQLRVSLEGLPHLGSISGTRAVGKLCVQLFFFKKTLLGGQANKPPLS